MRRILHCRGKISLNLFDYFFFQKGLHTCMPIYMSLRFREAALTLKKKIFDHAGKSTGFVLMRFLSFKVVGSGLGHLGVGLGHEGVGLGPAVAIGIGSCKALPSV